MKQSLYGEKKNGWRDPLIVATAVVAVICMLWVRNIALSQEKSFESSLIRISSQIDGINRQLMAQSQQQHHQPAFIQQQPLARDPQPQQQPLMQPAVHQTASVIRSQLVPKAVAFRREQTVQKSDGNFHHTGNDLHNEQDKVALQDIYQIYHSQRGDTCTGCSYVKPILESIHFSSVLDAGAANCKVTRAFLGAGKSVKSVELSSYVLQRFCSDLVADGTAYNAAVHELDMFSSGQFDFVFCADVLEHVPQANVEETLAQFARVGTKYFFFVIHDAPAQKDKKSLTKDSKYKIHETVEPRAWWLENLAKFGIKEDKEFRNRFLIAAKHTMPKELLSDKQMSRLYFMIKD